MNGVEILASSEVVVETAFNWQALGICLCVAFIFCLFAGFIVGLAHNDILGCMKFGLVVGILYGGVLGIFNGFKNETPVVYETQYKVTISDEVSMNSFIEKYEVLDQEGKIYTVREKK